MAQRRPAIARQLPAYQERIENDPEESEESDREEQVLENFEARKTQANIGGLLETRMNREKNER
ncbi:MAG: hypothetical protein AAF978_05230, partial [Cyanobacteria bacterium P01_E01_bin.48]